MLTIRSPTITHSTFPDYYAHHLLLFGIFFLPSIMYHVFLMVIMPVRDFVITFIHLNVGLHFHSFPSSMFALPHTFLYYHYTVCPTQLRLSWLLFSYIYIYVWHTCSCSDLFCSARLNLHNANTHPNIPVSVLCSKYCSGVLSAHTDFYISDSVWRRSCILPLWPCRHDLVTCNSCHFSPLTPFSSDSTFDFFAATCLTIEPVYLIVYICLRLYFVLPFCSRF